MSCTKLRPNTMSTIVNCTLRAVELQKLLNKIYDLVQCLKIEYNSTFARNPFHYNNKCYFQWLKDTYVWKRTRSFLLDKRS